MKISNKVKFIVAIGILALTIVIVLAKIGIPVNKQQNELSVSLLAQSPESTAISYSTNPGTGLPKPIIAQNTSKYLFTNPMNSCPGSAVMMPYNSKLHTGIDYSITPGCKVEAVAAGVITKIGWCDGSGGSMGYCLVIKHENGYSSLYGHLNGTYFVQLGDHVDQGQIIAVPGSSGLAFGPLLHLSISANNDDIYNCISCRIDPKNLLEPISTGASNLVQTKTVLS